MTAAKPVPETGLMRPVPAAAADSDEYHGAWVDIDLAALASNVRVLRKQIAAGVRLLAVLKCDAYGHGAAQVAPVVLAAGVDAVGVGSVAEGVRLRAVGVQAPIWVMAGVPVGAIGVAIAHALELVALDPHQVAAMGAQAEAAGRRIDVHAMVDVGLGRDGCDPATLTALVTAIEAEPGLRLVGLGANLATFDASPTGPLDQRVARFDALTQTLAASRPGVLRHAANSTAALGRAASHFDMVRLGDALYGLLDAPDLAATLGIQPVMAVRAHLTQIRRVQAGATVGYDSAWTVPADTWLGTVPAGFGDGLPYKLAAGGVAVVNGSRRPVVGRIGMTATVVDLGDAPVPADTLVTLLGESVTLSEWAKLADTDPYDLTTRVGRSLPRRYR